MKTTRAKDKSFNNKVVVITGGSRGLGFAIAEEFLKDHAKVVLLARDEAELENARTMMRTHHSLADVTIYPVDITKEEEITRVFNSIVDKFGAISVWVNNAGSILVSPYDSLVEADFRAQMELHLFAVVRLCRLAISHFRQTGVKGRIINICSLGGKIAVPHMLTYDTSKFALAGYSQGLAAELAPEGITLTTIYPTVMRTGSPIQAVFKGNHEKEYEWFTTTDTLPLLSLGAKSAAKKIVKASRNRRAELVPSFAAKLRLIAGVLFPQTMAWTMKMVSKKMPKTQSLRYKTGAESETLFKQGPVYKAFSGDIKRTRSEFNQKAKSDAKFNAGL